MKIAQPLAALVLLAGTALAGVATAQEGNAPTESNAGGTDSPAATGFYTAAIDNNGSLVRGENVSSSKRLSTGVYEVIFTANVKQCVRVASIGLPNTGDPPSGIISTALRNNNNKGVYVRTGDTSGFSSNRPFQLIVICP